MFNTPEGKVKKIGYEAVDKFADWAYRPVKGMAQGSNAEPDQLLMIRKTFVAAEFKATSKKKPTPLQARRLKAIADAGGVALVIDDKNVEAFVKFLEFNDTTILTDKSLGALRWQDVVARDL